MSFAQQRQGKISSVAGVDDSIVEVFAINYTRQRRSQPYQFWTHWRDRGFWGRWRRVRRILRLWVNANLD
ncbi:MAG: hypothetical protein RIE73_03235 [Coleofasciculus sp. C1-SOL-03]|uniref:hypothetical protein n=1 Tax=Coleofasciculus sp. C1-SOL-03 TaxID=3069522 RepID=UPI0032F199C2